MPKLYFKYGAMGSSKTAQALMTKFNYEERGKKVWLIKPSIDTRDGADVIMSRVGISAKCEVIKPNEKIMNRFIPNTYDVIIADESQFFSEEQIDELREIVDTQNISVMCFGLRTDFLSKLFGGSKRLMEIADSVSEIKTICECGKKAIVNSRINENGKTVFSGEKIMMGGNDKYVPTCYKCWNDKKKSEGMENEY